MSSNSVPIKAAAAVRLISETGQVFLFSYSPKLRTLMSWSDNAKDVLGVKDSVVARHGNLFLRYVHPDDRFSLMSDLESALKGERAYRVTYRWIRPDNKAQSWLHCRASVRREGEEEYFDGMILDLTEEVTGPMNSLAGPSTVGDILAAFPRLVFTLDTDYRLMRLNRSSPQNDFDFGDTRFKRDNFRIGRPLLGCFKDLTIKKNFLQLFRSVIEGEADRQRCRVFSGDLVYSIEVLPIVDQNRTSGLLCVVSDITEIVDLERRLADLQRIDGLMRLAAGVTHNFNNALQSILGQASVINSYPDRIELVKEASAKIIEVSMNSSQLAKKLYELGSCDPNESEEVDLNLLVMGAVTEIKELHENGIKISAVFGSSCTIRAAKHAFKEAVCSLIRNAYESMPKGGSLCIKTGREFLSPFAVEDLAGGEYAVISVSDTGEGMCNKTIKYCRDPFYTTRNVDPGSGISIDGRGTGLSGAFAFVRGMGGALNVETQSKKGSTVKIYLPLEVETKEEKVAELPARKQVEPSVLVVDDDPLVLQSVSGMLSAMGYVCVLADCCDHAIQRLKENIDDIRIVLVDAVLTGASGAVVVRRLKKIKPDIWAIGFSGAGPEQIKSLEDAGADQVLQKPISADMIASCIRESGGLEVVGR